MRIEKHSAPDGGEYFTVEFDANEFVTASGGRVPVAFTLGTLERKGKRVLYKIMAPPSSAPRDFKRAAKLWLDFAASQQFR